MTTTSAATCSTDGCDGPIKVRGLCKRCYMREYRNGNLKATYERSKTGPTCTIEDCDDPVHGRGLCVKHHGRWKRLGDPLAEVKEYRKNVGLPCEADDCDRPAVVKGMCNTHDWQRRNKGETSTITVQAENDGPCSIPDCGRSAQSMGYCRTHYDRRLRGEIEWDRPIKSHAPHGSGHLNGAGYRVISVNGRPRLEHRHLVEQLLGRRLTRTETVHHVNGHRAENATAGPLQVVNGKLRSGNLELWNSAQPAGQEVPAKVAWAREILALYGDLVPEVTA